MPGPVVSILLRTPLSGPDNDALNRTIKSVSSFIDGERFYVSSTSPIHGKFKGSGRPFAVYRETVDAVFTPAELARVAEVFGFRPAEALVLLAEEDEPEDHRILGEVTQVLAENFHGLIEFGGPLPAPALGLEGVLEVPYEQAPQGKASTHVGTPQFLRSWLAAGSFRMSRGGS